MKGEKRGENFSVVKVLLPIVISVGVVVWMFWRDARNEDFGALFAGLRFDMRSILCILLGFMCMFGRDFGLTWRFRSLTDKQLSWRQAWHVDMLCEFTSCVTPSAVGGSSLAPVFLNSQGIEFGRATTLMLTTLFMDELFFVVACPFVVLFTPSSDIFASEGEMFSHGMRLTFWFVYGMIALWTGLLFAGIIWRPKWIYTILMRISRWRLLRRWGDKIVELGDNMVSTSVELRSKPLGFWFEIFGATALSWTARYLVVNVLFFGFIPSDDHYQWVILARQFVIWVVLMVAPTPGGAGLSEWLFTEYYGDLISTAGLGLVLAILWRVITYYLYLLIGAILVPGWLKKEYSRVKTSASGKSER